MLLLLLLLLIFYLLIPVNCLVDVISLCEARNRTTSLFSFLMGTISNRHQKDMPVKIKVRRLFDIRYFFYNLMSYNQEYDEYMN